MNQRSLLLSGKIFSIFQVVVFLVLAHSGLKAQFVFESEQGLSQEIKTAGQIDLEFEAGGWYPLGNLRNTFESGVSIGGRMGVPLKYNLRVDVGAHFNTPSQAENILYEIGDTVMVLNGARTYTFLFGTRLAHSTEIGDHFLLESAFGIGLGLITSNQPRIETGPNFDDHYRIGTVQITAGASVHRKIGKTKTLGFFADYNFAPYSLFGRVDRNFGHSYVRTGVSMRFVRSLPAGNGADQNGWYMPEDPRG